jgi:hypothetical protein
VAELGAEYSIRNDSILRYGLQARLQKVLATGPDVGSFAESASGTMAVAGSQQGLQLLSNAGRVIRQLPVPDRRRAMPCAGGPPPWCSLAVRPD